MENRLGRRIRAFRKLKNLTQRELADRIHLSVAVLGAIERGAKIPSPHVLRAIGEALGIDEQELVGGIQGGGDTV
ncbi:helix-turn-helix transcriptional regulator [Kyrpidia sp.]|uniref:helix-turn-helix domain-containing protein n=1 Tax=Kyrpidia sp. TaxID=2073077 RepID=UPI001829DFCD|nr:helix-turn-helix transcriptional regulator [Kyrpidia sp.]MCL6576401.1 helix-turn-helix domain-containing protein [Kyrpidia sp.]HHY66263.1 helix-turn-helix transcriptional regulator [Alicyclobacillus sp.]